MKIDRLMGIVFTLLQKEKVTAPEFAEKYEVSRRTINRDIEDLCKAGIPIVTTQGVNGGISIYETYKVDKTFFNKKELEAILTGLNGLNSVTHGHRYRSIMDKLSCEKEGIVAPKHIWMDLASHYKNSLAPKIESLQNAIEQRCAVTFTYFKQSGDRKVTLDPYLVVFQWSNWYVLGIDHKTLQFKLYKLNRLWHLECTEQHYDEQELPPEKLMFNDYFKNEINVSICFDATVKHRLIEAYGLECFTPHGDNQLLFQGSFTNEEYLIQWVLSFGDKAELLEPLTIREAIRNQVHKMMSMY